MRPRTQTTRTNHLGYDVGASRKIPDGAPPPARVATVRLFDTDGDGMLSMEWAEEEAHIPTSYWDEVGYGKPNASGLKRALADTVLVDAAWLAQLADAGDILPRCQDLPEGARVTLEEMEQWNDGGYTVGVLVISYPWWASPPSTRPPCLEPCPPPLPRISARGPPSPLPARACTGSTPTTRTRTGCSCARSQRC